MKHLKLHPASHPVLLTSSLLLFGLMASGCGPQDPLLLLEDPVVQQEQPLVNGKTYNGHPSVGRLVAKMGSSGASCTATLVGKHTVLTAAHCVYPGTTHIFYLGNQSYSTTRVVRHPQYSGSSSASNDIGLVRLNSDPPVTPSEVSKKPPVVGQKLTLIGYGVTSTNAKDSGVKRIGYNTVATVSSTRFTFNDAGGSQANTCSGDSGGPAFATVDGREVHLGVHSMASRPCGARGYNTRTDAYHSWLMTQSAGDLYEHKSDITKPKVSITAPGPKASVGQDFTVQVRATDDRGVKTVELFLDGKSQGKQNSGDADYDIRGAASGPHTLRAEALDNAGNKGQAQISVTVMPPKEYGEACSLHLECRSGYCATDTSFGVHFCSQKCDLKQNVCPQQAPCVPAAGTNLLLCALPLTENGDGEGNDCSMAPAAVASSPPAAPALLLLALALAGVWLRRRRD